MTEEQKGNSTGETDTRLGEMFQYEFNQVKFASRSNIHRAKISSANNGAQLWVENKKTKQQWQATINDVSKCGPAGVPNEAVLAFLKKAFEFIDGEDVIEAKADDPSVDFIVEGGEVSLVLTLCVCGVWRPKFTFTLLPVGLDKIDVLEAKLRDAQEENRDLRVALEKVKEELETVYLSLTTTNACANGAAVQWNVLTSGNASLFTLSSDQTTVSAHVGGTYVIQIRLGQRNNTNGQSMALQKNGADVALCFQCDNNNYYNTAHIYEIISLESGDKLQVKCNASCGIVNTPLTSRFILHRIGP